MEQFQISKKPFWNRIYKRLLDYFTKKYKQTENLVIDPISVKLPTPYLLVIRFSVTNKSEKYELAIQGDWRNWYAEMSNNPDLVKPSELDVEMVIKHRHQEAYKISERQVSK